MIKKLLFIPFAALLLIGCESFSDLDTVRNAIDQGGNGDATKALIAFAEGGDIDAQILLASLYLQGRGLERNRQRAWAWYQRAADAGNAEAQFAVGSMYAEFFTLESHVDQAIKWYGRAAEQDHLGAQTALGLLYRDIRSDRTEARRWLSKAVARGSEKARSALDEMRAAERMEKKRDADARARKRAAEGKARKLAAGAKRQADEAREAAAEKALGGKLSKARQGDAEAQYRVAIAYAFGRGVQKDFAKALKWYRKAAEQGNKSAQYNLGFAYYQGEEVKKDYAEAAKWYRMAAEQGYTGAQYKLGFLHRSGEGVPEDLSASVRWFRRASEQGHHYSQEMLAQHYRDGEGVPQDNVQALKWLELAIAKAKPSPMRTSWEKERETLTAGMIPEEIAEAKRLASEWNPKEEKATASEAGKDKSGTYAAYVNRRENTTKEMLPLAKQGDALAQYRMGRLHEYRGRRTKDYSEAVKWYRLAAGQGHAGAGNGLAMMCFDGKVECQAAEKIQWFRTAAQASPSKFENASAGHLLGQFYQQGTGVGKDAVEAYVWYTRAIAGDHPDAWRYREDLKKEGMTADQVAAAEKRAGAGLSAAGRKMVEAAAAMNSGDTDRGLASFRAAAEMGYAPAQHALASIFQFGGFHRFDDTFEKDAAKAAKWYREAALQGDLMAANNYALALRDGKGVEKDERQAFRFFRYAAEAGFPSSQWHLAESYGQGQGTPKDPVVAYMWYTIAADDRLYREDSDRKRKKIAGEMTPEQISLAEKMAEGWLPLDQAAPKAAS